MRKTQPGKTGGGGEFESESTACVKALPWARQCASPSPCIVSFREGVMSWLPTAFSFALVALCGYLDDELYCHPIFKYCNIWRGFGSLLFVTYKKNWVPTWLTSLYIFTKFISDKIRLQNVCPIWLQSQCFWLLCFDVSHKKKDEIR